MGVAVAIDGRPLDELHHEERAAPGVRSAVEQTRDAGMLQVGEDLPFTLEAAARVLVRECERQHFQRDLLRERAIGTLGEIDDGHAAASDLTHDSVGAEAIAGAIIDAIVHARRCDRRCAHRCDRRRDR